MPSAIDITDPLLAKAYSHPLRIHILQLLDGRVASPRELADELGAPLANTSYHVRQLVSFGLVELVGRTTRRGAIEHHYTSRGSPTISDDGWGEFPNIVKRTILRGGIKRAITDMAKAAEEGGFDRPDIHYTRTFGTLDRAAWEAVARELQGAYERIDKIVQDSTGRANGDPEAEPATIILMHFGGPASTPPDGRPRDEADAPLPDAELSV